MQGFNDWLAYQQAMMGKMSSVMTQATPNLPDLDLQGQAKALTDAWATQTQRANDAIAQMSKAWTDATAGMAPGAAGASAAPGWPTTLPNLPNLLDPALQDKVKAQLETMFAKVGVAWPGMAAGSGLPSVADAMLERLTKAPAFAHLFDLDKNLVGLVASWTKLHTANLAYRTLVAKAWTEMQQAALQKAGQNALAASAQPALDWSQGIDTWLADLNGALTGLMRTAEYAAAHKQLVAAGTEVREQLRKLGNDMAGWFQPTGRDEVDDLAAAVADMRKQLRRRAPAGAAAAGAAAAAPAPAKSKPRGAARR
jgi:hypothetical protein